MLLSLLLHLPLRSRGDCMHCAQCRRGVHISHAPRSFGHVTCTLSVLLIQLVAWRCANSGSPTGLWRLSSWFITARAHLCQRMCMLIPLGGWQHPGRCSGVYQWRRCALLCHGMGVLPYICTLLPLGHGGPIRGFLNPHYWTGRVLMFCSASSVQGMIIGPILSVFYWVNQRKLTVKFCIQPLFPEWEEWSTTLVCPAQQLVLGEETEVTWLM